MPNTEIPAGTRAVVITFDNGKKVVFDLLREEYGVTLATLTSRALNAMLTAGYEFSSYKILFSE